MINFGKECVLTSFKQTLSKNCLNCNNTNAIQIYLGNSSSTTLNQKIHLTNKELTKIRDFINSKKLIVFIHSTLVLNMCHDHESKRTKWMFDNVLFDIRKGAQMGVNGGIVIHPGTIGGIFNGDFNKCFNNFVKNIKFITSYMDEHKFKGYLLIETPARSKNGNKIGTSLKDFSKLSKLAIKAGGDKIGICLDTQHIFTSGYDIRTPELVKQYFKEFNKLIGIKHIKLIHLNDSKVELGAQLDRHESIGTGYIFDNTKGGSIMALDEIINVAEKYNIPLILETPNNNINKNIKLIKNLIKTGGGYNKYISIFKKLYQIYDAVGNQYRAAGYKKAIQILENNNYNKLTNKMKNKIKEINETGKLKQLNNLLKDKNTETITELTKIRGIGCVFAKKLIALGVCNINDLHKPEFNKLLTTSQKIYLKYYPKIGEPVDYNEAISIFNKIRSKVKKHGYNIKLAGSIGRGKKTNIKDIDIIIYNDIKPNINDIINIIKPDDIIDKNTFIINNRQVDIRTTTNDELPFFELFFSIGEENARKLRLTAKNKGYKLNEKGLFLNGKRIDVGGNKPADIIKYINNL